MALPSSNWLKAGSTFQRNRSKIFGLFFLALLVRWLFAFIYVTPFWSDMGEYHSLACALLKGEYGYWFIYRPPVYPLFLAGIYKIFGAGSGGYLAVRLIQGAIGAVSCWLVFKIAKHLGDDRAAYLSYIIVALYMSYITFASVLLTETLFTFLLLLTIFCLLLFADTPRTKYIILAGIFAALTSLTRSTFLAVIPFISLWMFFSLKQGIKKTAKYFTCFCLVVLMLLIPDLANKYKITGQIKLGSFNGGMNFALGSGVTDAQLKQVYANLRENKLPEIKSEKIFYKMGLERVKQNPAGYLNKMLWKLIKFFVSKDYYPFFEYRANSTQLELAHKPNNRTGYYILHSLFAVTRIFFIFLVLPCSVLAFFFVKQDEERPRVTLHLFGLVISIYTLLHLFFVVKSPRMRMPIDALFIILAAYSCMKLLTLYKKKKGG